MHKKSAETNIGGLLFGRVIEAIHSRTCPYCAHENKQLFGSTSPARPPARKTRAAVMPKYKRARISVAPS